MNFGQLLIYMMVSLVVFGGIAIGLSTALHPQLYADDSVGKNLLVNQSELDLITEGIGGADVATAGTNVGDYLTDAQSYVELSWMDQVKDVMTGKSIERLLFKTFGADSFLGEYASTIKGFFVGIIVLISGLGFWQLLFKTDMGGDKR